MAEIDKLYDLNYLEYASYVIKERAIPNIEDGFKPVQRRILHTLFELDDGKFHKVANVVGQVMKYHPHGDASIYEALVVLANKDLFIDKQGNFGNIYTGDVASAARYIECRITPLARDTLLNPEITSYLDSYDGRNQEPVTFPAKIPVLLIQGTEGIAVGMSTKILPHNFQEVVKAQIACLRGRKTKLYPDFPTAGMIDVSQYDDGNGKIISRARLDTSDPKKILITEIPAGTTTESVISSIEDASKKNKIKVGSIHDFTAEKVEIEIKLPRGSHTEDIVDALYAFTDCEVSISTSLTVIKNKHPAVVTVQDVIQNSADRLVEILTAELKIEEGKLRDRMHMRTLEMIFIENAIYRKFDHKEDTLEGIYKVVRAGLKPHLGKIKREVTDEDLEKLVNIPLRRISLFDMKRAQKELQEIRKRLKEIKEALNDIKNYSIAYLKGILEKYGKKFPRRSEITDIEKVDVREAAKRNLKLRYDKKTGYLGTNVNGDLIEEVSPYDRVIVIRKSGTWSVIDAPEKLFVDKGMLFCGFVDKDRIYNVAYKDPKKGQPFLKRCKIEGFILNRTYEIVPDGSTHLKFEMDSSKILNVQYKEKPRQRIKKESFKIEDAPIRGHKAGGIRMSNYEVRTLSFDKKKL